MVVEIDMWRNPLQFHFGEPMINLKSQRSRHKLSVEIWGSWPSCCHLWEIILLLEVFTEGQPNPTSSDQAAHFHCSAIINILGIERLANKELYKNVIICSMFCSSGLSEGKLIWVLSGDVVYGWVMPDRSNTVHLSHGVIKFPLAHHVRRYLEHLMGQPKIRICIIHKNKTKTVLSARQLSAACFS